MFSQLGPLFKTQFRQAESNDTRQYIPHEERENSRQKEKEEERQKEENAWVDDTSVSVGALRAFLIDFLKTLPGGEDYNINNITQSQDQILTRPKEANRPTNTHSAKAVRAYQTMAEHAKTPPSEEQKEKDNTSTVDKLASKELRDIHALITDLEHLEKRGIATLHILKANSFVESMTKAVELEKSKF